MNTKSRLAITACGFLLATQFASAAQPGLPPEDLNYTVVIPAKSVFYACEFNISLSVAGKSGIITLPGDRFIVTSPGQSATLVNLDSNPPKEVKLNVTGSSKNSTNEQGDMIYQPRGRNLLGDPGQANANGWEGLVLAIGKFSYVFDSDGNLIQPLEGKGTLTKVCDLIR